MYRVGKTNRKALLDSSGHLIALFNSELLAEKCAKLLNLQEKKSALKTYNGVMAYYIGETKHCGDIYVSDYKGGFCCHIVKGKAETAKEIQRVLSYDIISKLSVKELKKVTKVKTKYKITEEEQIDGDTTYSLHKDTLDDVNLILLSISVVMILTASILIAFFTSIKIAIVLLMFLFFLFFYGYF